MLPMILTIIVSGSLGSFFLCLLMRKIAPRLGYMDIPAGRKSHQSAIPLGGGVAIVVTFILIVAAGLLLFLSGKLTDIQSFSWLEIHQQGILMRANQVGGILLGALILMVMGIFDDVKDLGPIFKLLIQFAVAALVVIGFNVRLYLFVQGISFGWPVTILWIVVITNAINFMDNTDGLAAGVSLICTAVLLTVAVMGGQIFVAAFLACLAGVLVGFLFHNFPPAKIFLGDAGSLPLGFLLAVGSVLTTYYFEHNPQTQRASVLMPLIVLAIPLYDFFSVIILRCLAGVSPLIGDHRHFSHRLINRGLSKRKTVLTIYLASIGTAISAIMLQYVSWPLAGLVLFQTICIVAIIAILEYQPGLYRE